MGNTYLVVEGVVYDLVERKSATSQTHQQAPKASTGVKSVLEDLGESKPCDLHQGKRLWHKKGKFGPFWTHKNDDGSYHNIKDEVVEEEPEDIEF